MSNVTQTGAVGEVVVTQTGQEAAVTVVTARGPQGEPGPDASVTNANVNAAIDDDPAATRNSLDLGTAALADTGTGASNVILGNDARLTDARTPTAHASSHVTGGTDKIRDASAAQDGLMTTTFAAKLNGIEAGADVTDSTNVNAAGAVMESDYSPSHSILVQQSGTGSPSSLSIGNNTLVGRLSGGGSAIDDLSASQVRTLLNVEDGADVTDAANVASTITGAAAKTTLVDADETVLTDSAASFGLKKVTWLNVWNYIVTKIGAITSITAGGAWSFSSTTRPTSSGTGTPTATSLITATDRRTEEVSDLTNLYYRQIMGHELGVWATVGISPSSVIDGNSRTGCRFIGTTGLSSASAQGGGIKYPDGGITGGSTFDFRRSFDLRFLFRNSIASTIFDIAHFVSLRNNTNFWSASSIGLYHVAQPADTWTATTAYTVGNRINVSGIVYVCSTSGTSGLTQPTFNATINGTTNDLTAVWRTLGPHTSDKWALAFVDTSSNITLTDTGVAWVAGTTNTTALRLRSNGSSVFASVNESAEVSVSRGALAGATPYIMCRGESASTSRIAGLIWTTESLL